MILYYTILPRLVSIDGASGIRVIAGYHIPPQLLQHNRKDFIVRVLLPERSGGQYPLFFVSADGYIGVYPAPPRGTGYTPFSHVSKEADT